MSAYSAPEASKRRPTEPPQFGDEDDANVVRYRYRQERYRAAEGKFDGSLNAWGERGWKVESIDRFDDIYLVTYSKRVVASEVREVVREARSYVGFQSFADDYMLKLDQGWSLEFSTAVGDGRHPFFACVWVKSTR